MLVSINEGGVAFVPNSLSRRDEEMWPQCLSVSMKEVWPVCLILSVEEMMRRGLSVCQYQ